MQVVEPESSIFDFKTCVLSCTSCHPSSNSFLPSRISTYLIVLSLVGFSGYYTYITLAPQPKKRKAAPQVSAPVGTVTATGAGGYQEEWIPEHHLKKTKKSKAPGAASGDETSGVESGTEGRKRKGKK